MTVHLAEAPPTSLPAGERLRALLAEPVADARHREATTFARAAGERSARIVLFGAGGLGRRTLAGLRAAGIEPLGFADNRAELWGSAIDGLEVCSPADAADRYGATAAFVVTIWRAGITHRYAQTAEQLAGLGCDVVVPVAWLSWQFSDELLPFYALDLPSRLLAQADLVEECFEILADDRSREEYVTQVEWRLFGDPTVLAHPVGGAQYLVTDVATPRPGDVVLDCGAYDGDTLRDWIAARGASFSRYLALEPDPGTRARLEGCVAGLAPDVAARVEVLGYGVSDRTGQASFSASGLVSSSLSEGDGIAVDTIRLDDLDRELGGIDLSFLKVDIEGAELGALEGAAGLLRRTHPMIAIASYHCQDHLWRVPLAVRALWPEYRCFFRPHNEEGWDLILYAVPPERVPAP